MGCFNTTGFISQLPILGGNKVVCFIATVFKEVNGGLYTPSALVAPYFLPIYGEYNEYGYLENIQETFVTKILEKYSGVSIEKLTEKIAREEETRLPKNLDYDKEDNTGFTLLFEHEDIYNKITEAPTYLTKYKDTMYESLTKYIEFVKKAKAAKVEVIPRLPFSITNDLRDTDSELSYTDLSPELEEEYSKIISIKDTWKLAVFRNDDTMFLFDKLSNEDELTAMLEGKEELSKFLNLYALYTIIPSYFKLSKTAGEQQYSLKAFETIHKVVGSKLQEMKKLKEE